MKYLDGPFWQRLVDNMNAIQATGSIWWVWMSIAIICLGQEYVDLEERERALDEKYKATR